MYKRQLFNRIFGVLSELAAKITFLTAIFCKLPSFSTFICVAVPLEIVRFLIEVLLNIFLLSNLSSANQVLYEELMLSSECPKVLKPFSRH